MSADDDGGLRNTLYRTTTRSGRRMTRARRWLYRISRVTPIYYDDPDDTLPRWQRVQTE
jgi:hypothetical protein